MENSKFAKQVEGYLIKEEDFAHEAELLVTITLHEYRELVGKAAVAENEVSKANSARRNAEEEVKKLKQRVGELEGQICALVTGEGAEAEED